MVICSIIIMQRYPKSKVDTTEHRKISSLIISHLHKALILNKKTRPSFPSEVGGEPSQQRTILINIFTGGTLFASYRCTQADDINVGVAASNNNITSFSKEYKSDLKLPKAFHLSC